MIGILYFSGTGNSLYIAKKLKEDLGGKVLYIPNYVGNGSEFEKIIIVTPIYSYGMPKHVYELLPRLDKEKELIVVQNYGGMIAGADYLMYQFNVSVLFKKWLKYKEYIYFENARKFYDYFYST